MEQELHSRDSSGHEDHAVGDDGLAVDAGEGLGGLLGEDGGLGRHCDREMREG